MRISTSGFLVLCILMLSCASMFREVDSALPAFTVPPMFTVFPNTTIPPTDNTACLIYPTCDVCSSSNDSCIWCGIGNGSCVVDIYNNTACPFEYQELGRCELNLTIGGVALSVVAILLGFVATFFGYRLFKFTLFFAGFIIAAGLTFILLSSYASDQVPHWAIITISVVAGVIVGAITFKLFLFGLFVIGGLLGVGIATFILSLKDGGLISTEWGAWLLTGGLFIAGGILALFIQKIVIILATTVSGAYGVITGISYYVQREFADVVPSLIRNDFQMIQFTNVTWGLLGGLVALVIAGLIVQFKLTGKKFDHREREKEYPREYYH